MTKIELNDKLAELYGIDGTHKLICGIDSVSNRPIFVDDLLIDDWSRLMDLAVDNGINIAFTPDEEYVKSFSVRAEFNKIYNYSQLVSDHESPQDAVMFSIAMALVKLAEVT